MEVVGGWRCRINLVPILFGRMGGGGHIENKTSTGKAAFKYFHDWEFRRYRAELNGVVLIRNYLLLLNRQEISFVYNHSRKDVKSVSTCCDPCDGTHIGTTEFGVAYLPEAKLSGLVNGHR